MKSTYPHYPGKPAPGGRRGWGQFSLTHNIYVTVGNRLYHEDAVQGTLYSFP